MTCNEARNLMYLDRNGERTPDEESALAQHVASCRECAGEAAAARKVSEELSRLRTMEPVLPNPGDLRDSVLKRIGERSPARKTQRDLLSWLQTPVFRVAASLAITLQCGFLLMESVDGAISITELEARLKKTNHPPVARIVTPVFAPDHLTMNATTDLQTLADSLTVRRPFDYLESRLQSIPGVRAGIGEYLQRMLTTDDNGQSPTEPTAAAIRLEFAGIDLSNPVSRRRLAELVSYLQKTKD